MSFSQTPIVFRVDANKIYKQGGNAINLELQIFDADKVGQDDLVASLRLRGKGILSQGEVEFDLQETSTYRKGTIGDTWYLLKENASTLSCSFSYEEEGETSNLKKCYYDGGSSDR